MNTQTDGWEAEFDNLPQTDMTTKDFIRNLLSADRAALAREVKESLWQDPIDCGCSADEGCGCEVYATNKTVDAVLEIIRNKKS